MGNRNCYRYFSEDIPEALAQLTASIAEIKASLPKENKD
jgi:hypothetical protein